MKTESEVRATETDVLLDVLRLRRWQLGLNEDLKGDTFEIPIHVAIGHEALAVAVSKAMDAADQLVLTHRNMAYNLLRADDPRAVYDEYLLLPSGAAAGRLGSMNLTQPERGIVYSSSVLGNNVPVACGLALAKDVKDERGIVFLLTGDGAMEEGTFYESLVLARSHGLRVMIVVENNDHSMWSTISERRCEINLDDMARSVGIPFVQLSGNDPIDYVDRVKAARDSVESSGAPVLVEALLAPLNSHAGPTPGWADDPKRITLDNGLVVEESSYDPAFVIREKVGAEAFESLAARVMDEDLGTRT